MNTFHYEAGNLCRVVVTGVGVPVVPEDTFDFTVVHPHKHDAVVLPRVDDLPHRSELDATPILELIVATSEHHDHPGPFAVDGLEKRIKRGARKLRGIVPIIEISIRT